MKNLLPLVTVLFALTSCGPRESAYQSISGMVWNTEFHITYSGSRQFEDSVITVMDIVGRSLSVFDENSLVSKVNSSLSTPVDDHFVKVYEMSREINRRSNGKFDPTLSPLITAWGFGKGHKVTNDTAKIDSILVFTGIEKTGLRQDTLYKNDIRTQFNFSAIAKGYGCDMVAEMLRRNGVENYLIEIGGEIVTAGSNPAGGKWKISIDRPIGSDTVVSHESQSVIEITDGGLATSGNYRNFHTENGERFGHTILPSTGRPVQTDVISATVIAPTAMEADGLATACMAMGSGEAMAMCDSLKYPAMLILADSTVRCNPYFEQLIVK